jgi:hypothetical protein
MSFWKFLRAYSSGGGWHTEETKRSRVGGGARNVERESEKKEGEL